MLPSTKPDVAYCITSSSFNISGNALISFFVPKVSEILAAESCFLLLAIP